MLIVAAWVEGNSYTSYNPGFADGVSAQIRNHMEGLLTAHPIALYAQGFCLITPRKTPVPTGKLKQIHKLIVSNKGPCLLRIKCIKWTLLKGDFSLLIRDQHLLKNYTNITKR